MTDRPKFSAASLCLYSTTHRAADVAPVLGLVPTTLHELGDENRGRKTGKLYGHHTSAAWIVEGPPPIRADGDDGFAALRALLAHLGDLSGPLASLRPHYTTAIRWSGEVSNQGNFTMEAALIADLARLGCELYGTAYTEDVFAEDS